MTEFAMHLFSSEFMPHGVCFLWNPEIVWLHAISDGIIAVSYFLIPIALFHFVRQRHDLPFHWIFLLFCLFILGCGATHVMGISTLWHGTYRLEGGIKAATAGAAPVDADAPARIPPQRLPPPGPAPAARAPAD